MKPASRLERVQTLTAAAICCDSGQSEPQAAASIRCPRSTLRAWARSQPAAGDAPAKLAAFVATGSGCALAASVGLGDPVCHHPARR